MRITRREKHLALAAALLIGAGSIYALAIAPARQRLATLERVLPEKAAALEQVRADATECERLSAELTVLNARVTQQPEDFELLAWLEEGARRCGCEPEAIRPRREEMEEGFGQVVVEVTFKGVQVEALARFMSRIATAPGAVALRDLHISQGLTPGRVDAACTVVHLTSE